MTPAPLASAPVGTPIAQPGSAPREERRPRLSVNSAASGITGEVDGAWWPRSRDLVGELGDLLPALTERLGHIERVSYRLTEWDPAARRVDIGGARIRLAGFRSQAAHTVDVLAERNRVTLLVIPPDTAAELASSAMETAGTDGDASTVVDLLPATAPAA